jgi:outer membrane protein assembly factor BamD (BamD/ComL family)
MKHAVLYAVIAMIAGSGCATFCPEQVQQPAADAKSPSAPAGALAEADRLLAEGKFADAESAYRRTQQEYSGTDWAPRANYAIATLLVSPDNPQRDYVRALSAFEDFITLYPQHERAAEARSWRQAIKQVLETKKDNDRLNKNIEMLKQLDLRQEQKRSGK